MAAGTFTYGNKVAVIILSAPLHGIIIESEAMSTAYRKQFNLLWKTAKKKKKK